MNHKIMLRYLKANRRAATVDGEWYFRLALVVIAALILETVVLR